MNTVCDIKVSYLCATPTQTCVFRN